MKAKNKKTIFICQITENSLKVVKCLCRNSSERKFVGLEPEEISVEGMNDRILAEKLNVIFKKLGYENNPVILSLTRNLATCRYLKVPTEVPQEIERIVSLQAARYLPYPANELITASQIILVDNDGFSHINLVIAHKDIIERYIKIFKEIKIKNFSIILSSYGLCNLYNQIKPQEAGPVMLVDIDNDHAELVIISNQKILFSRYFKLNRSVINWEYLFIEEIDKTRNAYLKEISKEPLKKVVILGTERILKEVALPFESLIYTKEVVLPDNLQNAILNSTYSFASLIGLGLTDTEESLNLLPRDMKEEFMRISRRNKRLRNVMLISSIILIWGLSVAKDIDNKSKYLERLKVELNKIAKEAQPLEEIERRARVLESRAKKRISGLDVLYEVHQLIPHQISLINFNYEEEKQVVLRGQAPQLNSVFAFVAKLEKSGVFKGFDIKVRYATQKKTLAGEIVDFEIVLSNI